MLNECQSDDDDDPPTLSEATLSALNEFYKEQAEREAELPEHPSGFSFPENWQLSQFWYDDQTIEVLTDEAVRAAGRDAKIALISCPSLYSRLKAKMNDSSQVTLFEYDNRFSTYGSDFIYYDYKSPLKIPRELSNSFDLIIADPPFLSDECLTNTSVTVKFLAKEKIILCTGAVMADLAQKLLKVQKTKFLPCHKNNLANQFNCFTNYNSVLLESE